jgi:hypothetical protein
VTKKNVFLRRDQNESVFLSVNYIDRFLSKMSVRRCTLQLVGGTALFVGS